MQLWIVSMINRKLLSFRKGVNTTPTMIIDTKKYISFFSADRFILLCELKMHVSRSLFMLTAVIQSIVTALEEDAKQHVLSRLLLISRHGRGMIKSTLVFAEFV